MRALAGSAMRLAIDLVLILVTVIGGRIVPAFTANALRQRGETVSHRHACAWLEFAVIGAMVAIAITDVFAPDSCVEWFAGRDRRPGSRDPAQRLAQLQNRRRTHSLGPARRLRLAARGPCDSRHSHCSVARPGPSSGSTR